MHAKDVNFSSLGKILSFLVDLSLMHGVMCSQPQLPECKKE